MAQYTGKAAYNGSMFTFLSIVIALLLMGFWAYMLNDMWHNKTIPETKLSWHLPWPPRAKNQWQLFFIVLTVFTAAYYYFTEYKKKRQN